jgi:UMF1 family MFS transporter
MATDNQAMYAEIDEKEYQRRVNAWAMYDWANSAFATTILAAVLPIYFSQVAGATLPSAALATAYWSFGLSISLLLIAIISPILGTISDIMRGKKRFLAIFAGIGILSTAMLVFVGTGDWVMASIFAIVGRIGFNGSITFYDSLLPHVAREDDRDRVSARGYALGYLGGGLLLAINVAMIQLLPGTWGPRLSFLSVAIWWAIFSIPLFRRIPEPPAATALISKGVNTISLSFTRLRETLRDIRQYRQLFKFLLAFLIYNDGIGTIIGVAAIYGTELGFGSLELILALLLVQFVGIPYSFIFGRLPTAGDKRRPIYLAFVIFNLIALPIMGIYGARVFPVNVVGGPPEPFTPTAQAAGEGVFQLPNPLIQLNGDWQQNTIPPEQLGDTQYNRYASTNTPGSSYEFAFNGQRVTLTYSTGPDHGIWALEMDGVPLTDPKTGEPVTIDAYSSTVRYGVAQTFSAPQVGEHVLTVTDTSQKNPLSSGNAISLVTIQVLPGVRVSNLGLILLSILIVELVGVVLSFLLGGLLFSGMVKSLDTRRTIFLALVVYAVIAVWGYILNSVIEFWYLAWMVAVVQGGSQALSRSLYAGMSPASKSGEFFGLFGVMEKFSTLLGPLVFGVVGSMTGSSRPAVLSLVLFFIVGGVLLTRVNAEEGKAVAQAEDAQFLGREAS